MILEKVFDWLILWHRRRWRYFDWLGEVVVWLRSDRRPNHQSPHAPLCAARATTPIKNSAQNTILITPTHAHQGTATSSIDPSYSRQCINPGSWHYVTVQHTVMRCFKVCWCWYVFATRPVQSTASSDRKLHTVCFSIGWKQVFFSSKGTNVLLVLRCSCFALYQAPQESDASPIIFTHCHLVIDFLFLKHCSASSIWNGPV